MKEGFAEAFEDVDLAGGRTMAVAFQRQRESGNSLAEIERLFVGDSGAIGKIVDQVITANAQQVADYKAGKEKAFNSLVGQVMKASQGKANPAQVNEILKKKLG